MHYWNRANFEGLAQLSAELRQDERLKELALYCELREKGRRTEALAAQDRFIAETLGREVAVQREIALLVLSAHARTPAAHQLLTHPLRERLVRPVLLAWHEAEPGNATALGEIGLLDRNAALLERALRLDPAADRVRAGLISLQLGFVDHAMHHVSESIVLEPVAEVGAALDSVAQLLQAAVEPDSPRLQELASEMAELRRLFDDWVAYQAEGSGTFPEWCQRHQRTHRWWNIIYYEK